MPETLSVVVLSQRMHKGNKQGAVLKALEAAPREIRDRYGEDRRYWFEKAIEAPEGAVTVNGAPMPMGNLIAWKIDFAVE